MHDPPEAIATQRLVLRRPRSADAVAKYEYSRDPEVARYMDWVPHASLRSAVASIEGAASRWESGEEYSWVITVRPDDRAVGSVSCFVRDHAVEIGYVLGRDHWGRGYASEAAKAVLAWAGTLKGVFRVWATCDVENVASVRVLEKLGMSREGVLRRWALRPNLTSGAPRDAFAYSWVREPNEAPLAAERHHSRHPAPSVQIAIRFYEADDANALQQAARESTREVYPWLPWCHPRHSLEEARSWIDGQAEARTRGTAFEFVIVSQDRDFLGACGLNHIDETDRRANLGYWVRTSAAGKGVATAAVRAVANWAFDNTPLERLEVVVAAGNLGSQRVAEKAGAAREGIARSRLLLHGKFHDAVVYSIVRSSQPVAQLDAGS